MASNATVSKTGNTDLNELKAMDLQVAKVSVAGNVATSNMTHKMAIAKLTLSKANVPTTMTYTWNTSTSAKVETPSTGTTAKMAAGTFKTATGYITPYYTGVASASDASEVYYYMVKPGESKKIGSPSTDIHERWYDGDFTISSSLTANTIQIFTARSHAEGRGWVGYVGEFPFEGAVHTFEVPVAGTYKMQVWGGRGGGLHDNTAETGPRTWQEGLGGYSYGTTTLTSTDKLYVCVGGSGCGSDMFPTNLLSIYGTPDRDVVTDNTQYEIMLMKYGYNGVEASRTKTNSDGTISFFSYSGGGATHIAKNENYGLLANYKSGTRRNSILLVAGGGGGADCFSTGGYGGGETGGTVVYSHAPEATDTPTGGGQSAGGISTPASLRPAEKKYFWADGDFGSGGFGAYQKANGDWDGGGQGGGGWYGGGGSLSNGCGGGGSGHVGTGVTGATIGGNQEFDAPGGGKETGHAGSGYARITFVSF